MRTFAIAAIALLVALPLSAGTGNGIPAGQNPFEYLLGLINGLQTQINGLPAPATCIDISGTIAGTWNVSNPATGVSGQVTFAPGGSYTINSCTYNAGGTFLGKTSGNYTVLPGGAIAFRYAGSVTNDRIAVVQCASSNQMIHFVMGHTLDYEILTRVP